jgi:general secretion pathway protein D
MVAASVAVCAGACTAADAGEPAKVGELVARARCQFLAGESEAAAATFRQVETLDPHNADAAAFLARIGRQGLAERWRTRAEMVAEVDAAWRRPGAGGVVPGPLASAGAESALGRKLDAIVLPEVNFTGASLAGALATLAGLALECDRGDGERGVNLVLLDPTKANPAVTLAVRQLSLRRVLDYLTESVGYGYEVQADAVVVRPGGERTALDTAVLAVSRAVVARMTAGGAMSTVGKGPAAEEHSSGRGGENAGLREFLQQAGVKFDGVEGSSLVFDGSAILVTQTARNLARIRTILARYASVRQVEIEAKFIEVAEGALEELGIDWGASRRVDPVTGLPREKYATANRSVSDAFGGSHTGSAILIDGETVANVGAPVLPGVVPLGAGAAPLAQISGFIGEFDVSATIRALSQKQGSDLLSAPKVTVLSGHSASITVAQQLRYPRQFGQIQSQVGQSGANDSGSAGVTITAGTPQDFTTENVGVDLKVTPTVEEDEHSITLDLHPVVTEFEGFVEYGGPSLAVSGGRTVTIPSGFYQPIFSRREVTTRVTLWDGATLVMGGLTREETRKVNDKVPLLGDLPAVGRLFRSSGEGAAKRNLLIFVTASLVSPGGGPQRLIARPAPGGGISPRGVQPTAGTVEVLAP